MVDVPKLLQNQKKSYSEIYPGHVYPQYSGFSLANLPPSICNWLNLPLQEGEQLNGEYPYQGDHFDRVILLVVDGLGWHLLHHCLQTDPVSFSAWNELSARGQISPLTSISPSTTCAALTTLNTGAAPGAHGNLAYELWLKEFGVVANMITHAPIAGGEPGSLSKSGFVSGEFLPVSTLDTHLNNQGVYVSALHPAPIAHSSLTKMLYPKADLHAYHSLSDGWYRLEELLKESISPAYHFIYWGELDTLSHLYGPDDIRVKRAFRDFTVYLSDLLFSLPKNKSNNSILVITADHGQISTPVNEVYNLANHPDLTACFSIHPTGENRFPFIHIKPGLESKIRDYVEGTWPGEFNIRNSKDVVNNGLFGSGYIYPRTFDRLGDLVVIPNRDAYWYWSTKENKLLGRHGGFSANEMIVPLIQIPFYE